jgi:hypothetical protein
MPAEFTLALDGFQGGEPNEHEMQRIEPPRPPSRKREIKQRKSGIDLSSYTNSLGELGVLAVQFFDGIDRFHGPTWNPSRAFTFSWDRGLPGSG